MQKESNKVTHPLTTYIQPPILRSNLRYGVCLGT